MPGETINQFQVAVLRALFLFCLHHNHQYVGAGGVIVGYILVVAVVTGIRVQFRGARVEIADLQVLAAVDAERKTAGGHCDRQRGGPRAGQPGQPAPGCTPHDVAAAGRPVVLQCFQRDADIGHHDR